MSKADNKKDIMKKEENLPSLTLNFEEDTDSFEGITNDDRAIPFLKLLQTNSPECDESAPEYIKDARAGQFINTVTKELLGNNVTVVPCSYKRVFNKWGDRDKGGGFKGALGVESNEVKNAKQDERGRLVLENGDYLSDTRNIFLILVQSEQYVPMLLPFTSTQIKKAKNWVSQMQMLRLKNHEGKAFMPPMYSHLYQIESVTEKNDKGSWKGVKVSIKESVANAELYEAAKIFAKAVKEDKVKVQDPTSEKEEF